jgi:WD40 repeat protein
MTYTSVMRLRSLFPSLLTLIFLASGCSTQNDNGEKNQPAQGGLKAPELLKANHDAKPASAQEKVAQPGATPPGGSKVSNPAKPFRFDGPLNYLVFAPDNKTLIAGGRFWEVASGKITRSIGLPASRLCSSPDGRLLLFGDQSKVRLWDVAAGKQVWSSDTGHSISGVTFSGDGKRFAACSDAFTREKTHCVWETASKKMINKFGSDRRPWRSADSVALSPDGKYVAAHLGAVVRLWEVDTGKYFATLGAKLAEFDEDDRPESRAPSLVAFSPDGKYLASMIGNRNLNDQVACHWHWPSTNLVWERERTNSMIGFTPDSKYVVYGGNNVRVKVTATEDQFLSSAVQLREVKTGICIPRFLNYNHAFSAAAISPDGKKLAVARSGSHRSTWEVFDLEKDPPPEQRLFIID